MRALRLPVLLAAALLPPVRALANAESVTPFTQAGDGWAVLSWVTESVCRCSSRVVCAI